MAKLYFRYGVMGSSKTANALMVRYNYEERGQDALLVKPELDQRDGARFVASRAGLSHPCIYFTDLRKKTPEELKAYACIIVDEAQFLTREEVRYLTDLVDSQNIPVILLRPAGRFQGGALPRLSGAALLRRHHRGDQDHLLVRQEGHLQRPL